MHELAPSDCYQVPHKEEQLFWFVNGEPFTVASDIDGFIPLRFEPFSTIMIQEKQSNLIISCHYYDSYIIIIM